MLEARGEFEPSKAAYARALDILRAALGRDNRETLLTQKDLAMAWVNLGEYAKARELLEGALAARLEQDPNHMDVAVLRHNLGAVYWQLGEYAEARSTYRRALAIREKALQVRAEPRRLCAGASGIRSRRASDTPRAS